MLDGTTLPERLHCGRDHRRVPFRPREGNQSIFVTPTADHRVGVRGPSRWHADLARQIARRLLYGVDRQSPKPGLKGGSGGWIDLDTKDANDHKKTGELLFGRIRLSRTESPGCPPKTQHSRSCQAIEGLHHNGSHGSRTNAGTFLADTHKMCSRCYKRVQGPASDAIKETRIIDLLCHDKRANSTVAAIEMRRR